ncbi:hypothetical protein VUJ46_22590 [Chryseobacterium sp. MYb264]|uniref:hypothetical protein n=1 Tax=Chryseobacterium sp. MYb264 TaxID=2745153 RepID=UPI002E1644F8|nr:hypothetical protein VUJ46_22590 [Chryseobacterium sp. MYb264]
MSGKTISELTNEELLDKRKKAKNANIISAVLIGFFVGIAVFSAIKKGLGFFTFFPLIFVFMLMRNQSEAKELDKEIKSRNLHF